MNKRKRAKKIDEAIRLAWSSLESHLLWTHKPLSKQSKKEGETHKFHKKCVNEYARSIKILSELY